MFKIKDANTIILNENLSIKEINSNSIIINNKTTVSLKDKIEVNMNDYPTYYIVNYINKYNNHYLLKEFNFLIQNYFLLPSICNPQITLNPYFVNSYKFINHEDWKDNDDLLYLVYRFTPSEYFNNIDAELTKESNFIQKIKDNRFNIYIFKIPTKFMYYIDYYINNKVNLIDEFYKKKILKYFKSIPYNKEVELTINNSIFKLLTNESLLRKEMEKELGVKIPKEIQLIEKPTKEKLTWKMQVNLN